MIFSAIKIFGWTVPLLEFSVGPAVGVRLWWSNWFLVGVHPKYIYCVAILTTTAFHSPKVLFHGGNAWRAYMITVGKYQQVRGFSEQWE
jgi:hypothetical protein